MAQHHPYAPLPDTMATVIGNAAAGDRAAMQRLLELYLPALRSHLLMGRRWRGRLSEHDVEDLVHQFVLSKVIEKELPARYDPRFRFRNLLLTALDRFIIDQYRKRKLDPADIADVPEPEDGRAPQADAAFLVEAMQTVIEQTLERMHAEYTARGRPQVMAVFEARLVGPILRNCPPVPFEQLVADLGIKSVGAASNLMVTAKRSFKKHMAAVCADMGDQAEELTQLFRGVLATD